MNNISTPTLPNRWIIAIMGTLLQLCLGTVYAWSYFVNPLVAKYGWSNSQVTLTFSIAICFLGLSAAWGGVYLARIGPRKLAMTGGVLFGAGYLLAAAALHLGNLTLLYVGFGIVGGIGLGLGYVTPVATVAKWFPDRKGLLTGMVIMGFGFGALLMSKVLAPCLLKATGNDYVMLFAIMGGIFLVAAPLAGAFLVNPPAGFAPGKPLPTAADARSGAALPKVTPPEQTIGTQRALLSGRFLLLWLVFFCNIVAGIALLSLQSPLMQALLKSKDATLTTEALAATGATLIAVSSIFNGVGRFFWGGLSDRIGRPNAFRAMLLTGLLAFCGLILASNPKVLPAAACLYNPWVFGALVCYVLLCYGGGFGTMPSFVMDIFGPKLMAVVYGTILTAWSAAGIVGPLLFAHLKDIYKTDPTTGATVSFLIAGGFLLLGLVCSLFVSNKPLSLPENAGK